MQKIDVAGLKIDAVTKQELLDELRRRLRAGQATFMATPYSEFLYRALKDPEVMKLFNRSDIAVADGIGIFWARKFLTLPLSANSYYGKVFQAGWQGLYSLAAILLYPRWVKAVFPEKIPGSEFVWDLARLCADEGKSIFLLGGFGDTPKVVAEKLQSVISYFHGRENKESGSLKIAGWSNKNADDPTLIEDIKKVNPDVIFVAYGPVRQERWIVQNRENLSAKLYIGLGGTFDYIAGKHPNPPKFMRAMGLEWAYRLVTQPHRLKRIYRATIGLVAAVWRYKVFKSLPYRPNVVSVVINQDKKIFVARHAVDDEDMKILGYPAGYFDNFWQFPQGGIEAGEDAAEGAIRELWEETAIRNVKLLTVSPVHFEYDWREDRRKIFVRSRYRFRGQRQAIVYFLFTGTDKEIHLDLSELAEYKWVPIDNLLGILHPYKQSLLTIVQKDLAAGLVKLP